MCSKKLLILLTISSAFAATVNIDEQAKEGKGVLKLGLAIVGK